MKIHKTAAYDADRELTELLGVESRLYKIGMLDTQAQEVLRLATTVDELSLLLFEPYEYRPGFHADERQVTLPCFFTKVDGHTHQLMSTARKWKQDHNRTTLVYGGFHSLDQRPTTYSVKTAKELDQSALKEKQDLEPLAHLSEVKKDRVVQSAFKVMQWLDGELKLSYKKPELLAALLLDNRHILDAYHHTELTQTVPKCIVEDNQKKVPSVIALARMLMMHALGFDVLVVSKHHYSSIENYLPIEWFDHHVMSAQEMDKENHRSSPVGQVIGMVMIAALVLIYFVFKR
ncbi:MULTISPECIES: YceG family protein [unclassified Fusibacter]|uniref:YceG family protein n=1 Tax=unclassified Fusibacter TaxID=2624464 RepID=UPI001013B8BA|nr:MULTISPECIES: YceG family protein [unclassified Fusibacter]MCK8058273.1 YceG family protein [Fusibacter sp. A2]NPE20856.1 hypothetical protein [Fusibacter sp. A1]RXV63060.1 hypothetical protein DWB64_03410 [Fusibacter sp. A1]